MAEIILPKTYIREIGKPVIFLLGPIRSAPLWQDDAIRFLLHEDVLIASPRRSVDDSLKQYVASGDKSYFPRQRAWEWHYQEIASQNGALLFWLPKEAVHNCKKSYGLMTSNEFGHWTAMQQMYGNIPLVFGTDGGFNEWSTFEYDLKKKIPEVDVKRSLEETCREAAMLTLRK